MNHIIMMNDEDEVRQKSETYFSGVDAMGRKMVRGAGAMLTPRSMMMMVMMMMMMMMLMTTTMNIMMELC